MLGRIQMLRLWLLCIVLLTTNCANTIETVYIPSDSSGWKFGSGSDRRNHTIAEFVPSDESIDNWTRLLTIQFIEGESRSPQSLMDVLKSTMLERCPGSYWEVISQDSLSTLYEWKITNCSDNPDQHEIARLLRGNDGLHRIAYTEKTSEMDAATHEIWISTFKDAYVEKGGKKVVIVPN
jgi:hypothetical protein